MFYIIGSDYFFGFTTTPFELNTANRHIESHIFVAKFLPVLTTLCISSSLWPGFEGCSEIMNDPLYLRFVCLEQDEIFPEY